MILLVLVGWDRYENTQETGNESYTADGTEEQADVKESKETAAKAVAATEDAEAEEDEADKNETGDAIPEEMEELQSNLEDFLADKEGTWSVYVKNLNTGEMVSINNQQIYAASLIKLYVLEDCFQNMDTLMNTVAETEGLDEESCSEKIMDTITSMITVSDNESYNELIRLKNTDRSFTEGCLALNEAIQKRGYQDTGVFHTLGPSYTEDEATSDQQNYTSVEDCGALLESIYNGTCISKEASKEMLDLLLQQQVLTKIPAGIPEGIAVANKTGETDEEQHDVAIVYGEKVDYIICVMSTGLTDTEAAVENIQWISKTVYDYLNK
jgi:beta-lactamase class A